MSRNYASLCQLHTHGALDLVLMVGNVLVLSWKGGKVPSSTLAIIITEFPDLALRATLNAEGYSKLKSYF